MRISLLVTALALASSVSAQAPLADLNTAALGSGPRDLLKVNDQLFFVASDPVAGREVHVWTKSTGARLLADVVPSGGRAPELVGATIDRVLFQTPTGSIAGSGGLWSTDGSDLVEIGEFDRIQVGARLGDNLTFTAESKLQRGLFVTDGTSEGTELLVNAEWVSGEGSFFSGPMVHDGRLYFAAAAAGSSDLWSTDGTSQGTVRHGFMGQARGQMGILGQQVVFVVANRTDGDELWSINLDGTGVRQLWGGGGPYSEIYGFRVTDDKVFFEAQDPVAGYELHVYDRTDEGARLVADLNPGAHNFWPADFLPFKDGVIFKGTTVSTGSELWFSDGTESGTVMLADIQPGSLGTRTRFLAVRGGLVYFCAEELEHGMELWVSDGTRAGTRLLSDIVPGPESAIPEYAAFVGDRLLLAAYRPETGSELYSVDIESGDLRLEADLYDAGNASSSPGDFASNGRLASFVARDGRTGSRVWLSDGSEQGTNLVPGASAVMGRAFAPHFIQDVLYWRSTKAVWRHDTETGETRVREFDRVDDLEFGPGVLVLQTDSKVEILESESLVSLGTLTGKLAAVSGSGTVYAIDNDRVVTWAAGTGYGDGGLLPAGYRLQNQGHAAEESYYFTLADSSHTRWLFRSDGSLVERVGTDPLTSTVYRPMAVGDGLLFGGNAIWLASPDGITAISHAGQANPGFVRIENRILFTYRAADRAALWETDGTKQGTRPLQLLPGNGYGVAIHGSWNGIPLLSAEVEDDQQQFYFVGDAGLTPVGRPFAQSDVRSAALAGDRLLFEGRGISTGNEPWVLDLAAATGASLDPGTAVELDLDVYPNPTATEFIVAAPRGSKLEAYDMLGRRRGLWSTDIGIGETTIDVSAWPVGVYVLRSTGSGRSQSRLISVVR